MVRLPDNSRRVLARLSDVTQELTVGVAGASASVRTLTGVSLEVRERELVVLSGSPGAGERAVISVLAGDRRGVTGVCDVNGETRVRLFRIGARAAVALIQEWQRCDMLAYCAAMVRADDGRDASDASPLSPEIRRNAELHGLMQQIPAESAPPDLILLDVVRDASDAIPTHPGHATDPRTASRRVAETAPVGMAPWDERNRAALTAWAGVCRMRGGAVVMAAGNAIGADIFDTALKRMSGVRGPASSVRETFTEGAGVRVVPMHSGRLGAPVQLRIGEMLS